MSTSKIQLILELKNKLFNKKLMDSSSKIKQFTGQTQGKIQKMKQSFVGGFSAMRNQFPGFASGMDLVTNKFALMAAGAALIGTVMVSSVRHANQFNKEFLPIANLNLDKSKGELEAYKDTIRKTAFDAGTDLNATTRAFYDVQSATGLFGKEAAAVTASVAKFSVATGADLNDSINQTTKAMKAFGLGSKDIDAYLISNAKTVQVGITTFAELAQVQTEYAGAAAGVGASVDTANKVFAAFTSIAKDSNMAANMTKTAFQGLTQE
ncbi:MAG: phage tail tape measure protein, partial [Crocinitomicaceae bacterium]|nr:phage tail tape measure protein [Crocinitomicaceae bacterium]